MNKPDFTSATRPNIPPESAKNSALAYVLEFNKLQYAAFAPYVSQEFIERPDVHLVPNMAHYAFGLIEWRNQFIPLISLASLINAQSRLPEIVPKHCLVLAYRDAKQLDIRYGAVATMNVPESIYVSDDDFCGLANDSYLEVWREVSISCFAHKGRAVPVIDTDKLFNSTFD